MAIRVGWWLMILGALAAPGYASMALWNPDAIPFIARKMGVLRSTLILHGAVGAAALAIGPFQFIERLRVTRVLLHRVLLFVEWVLLPRHRRVGPTTARTREPVHA